MSAAEARPRPIRTGLETNERENPEQLEKGGNKIKGAMRESGRGSYKSVKIWNHQLDRLRGQEIEKLNCIVFFK